MADANKSIFESSDHRLKIVAYSGDNMVLLAMSMPDTEISEQARNLAGFAIQRIPQGKPATWLLNRLSFDAQITSKTTPEQRKWTPSDRAPFQKFRWVDVPPDGFDVPITYRVVARYFQGAGKQLVDGPSGSVTADPPQLAHSKFRVAFTRGYASSQAYADKFHNADIRPPGKKTAAFDTKPFAAQYEWLGADAYRQLFGFIGECMSDTQARVDVFAYDLDEPDVIKAMCELGKKGRLRAILDNADLHTKSTAVEPQAAKLIVAAAGKDNVKQGRFGRFQHNKVFIKRAKDGTPEAVLFGSMNFSLRGIYVQANNIIVARDRQTAKYFADAFDVAFRTKVAAGPFKSDAIASDYNVISATDTAEVPIAKVALSPHKDSEVSLKPLTDAIHGAQSSVFYAVMEPKGSGPVLDALQVIAAKPFVFSYGTVETDNGLAVQAAEGAMGEVTGYGYLKGKVPAPFSQEWSGGNGKHIHHKFVVVDFNGAKPLVATGSSNLAAGGEENNGDSLILIEDPIIASIYGIEAVRLFDHYSFRKKMKKATSAAPLTLWYPGKPNAPSPWWKPYYDKQNIKLRDRCLFAEVDLPAGVASVKKVDWSSLQASAKKAPAKKTAAKKKAAKKKAAKSRRSRKKAK